MGFLLIDFFVGFLMVGAMAHIVTSSAGMKFPSAFGFSPKANLFHGVLVAIIAVDIYFFRYGFDATISNSMLVGMLDLVLLYALFGRLLHKKIQKKYSIVS